jgi:hypothetical protein
MVCACTTVTPSLHEIPVVFSGGMSVIHLVAES